MRRYVMLFLLALCLVGTILCLPGCAGQENGSGGSGTGQETGGGSGAGRESGSGGAGQGTGSSGADRESGSGGAGQGTGSGGNGSAAGPAFDWYTEKFSMGERIEDGSSLNVTDFCRLEREGQEEVFYGSDFLFGTDGVDFYTLKCGLLLGDPESACLSLFDTAARTWREIPLPAGELEGDPEYLHITAAYMPFPGELAFQVTSLYVNEAGKVWPEQYRVIRMDAQGRILSQADLLPIYEAQGMIKEGLWESVVDCLLDGEGCIYTRRNNQLLITDGSGTLLMEKSFGEEGHTTIGDPVRSEEGKLIFPIRDGGEKTVRLVWFDAPKAQEYVLGELDYASFQRLYAMRGRHIYYGTLGEIIDWDTHSGERSVLFRLKENGILDVREAMLAFDGEGKPMFRVVYEDQDMVLWLGDKPGGREEVRIADLSWGSTDLPKSTAAVFSRQDPRFLFTCEKPEKGGEEAFRDRIMAQLTSGKGPDILYLSREDLSLFQEKGVLADLEELLSQDTLRELLPGAVGLGRVDGVLAGIPGEVYVRTIFTSPQVWDADTWTLGGLVELFQSGAQTKLRAILPTTAGAALWELALRDLEHSPFIDWEGYTCRFATKEFTDLLETVKTYSLDEELLMGRDWEMIREGECLGTRAWVMGYGAYESVHKDGGEDIIAIGLPSETGNGNYMQADGIFAVNASLAPDRKEVVSDYLEYVLSVKGQRFNTRISVRKNMITDDLVRRDEDGKVYLREDSYTWVRIEPKKDGSTYIRQYNEFLESCEPMPDSHEEIVEIIGEEADAFFGGGRTAQQTAEIIQGRVQTYLDEHR